MINFWYVARHGEILVDMDKPITSLPHFETRLRGAVAAGFIDLDRVEVHRSFSSSHLHLLLTLARDSELSAMERAIWALMFHSDIYRACNTLMRLEHLVECADLLITPLRFSREPDAVCECETKHTGPVMLECPAAIKLRGDDRVRSFFGRPVCVDPDDVMFDGDLSSFAENVICTGASFK